jgi:hypothetical protein
MTMLSSILRGLLRLDNSLAEAAFAYVSTTRDASYTNVILAF